MRGNYICAVFVNRAYKRKCKWAHENHINIFSGDLLLISNEKIKWQLNCSSCQAILLIWQKIISALAVLQCLHSTFTSKGTTSDSSVSPLQHTRERKRKETDGRGNAHRDRFSSSSSERIARNETYQRHTIPGKTRSYSQSLIFMPTEKAKIRFGNMDRCIPEKTLAKIADDYITWRLANTNGRRWVVVR